MYQKYLIKGHTQMECDTVHSHIEKSKKSRELHVPADFIKVITEASLTKKYNVKYLHWSFFKNYAALKHYTSIRPGKRAGDPCVVDLRALKYTPHSPIEFKLRFDDIWTVLPQRFHDISEDQAIPQLYSGPVPIKKRKYDDLQSLKPILPKDFHALYDSLLHV